LQTAGNTYLTSREQVVLDTITTVYEIINRQAREQTYQASVKRLQREVKSARLKAEVGLAGPLDIYRAEIEVKEAQDRYVSAQSEAMRARNRLKVLLSLPLTTRITVSAPMVCENIDLSLEEATAVAMERRADLRQMRLDLDELKRQVALARHNLLPRADLAVTYDTYNLFDSDNTEPDEYWSIRLVSDTELSRKREKATLSSRQLELQRKKLAVEQARERVKEEIGNRLNALVQAEKRLHIRRRQIRQAEKKLARAAIKFRHGMADNFELISSESDLQRSRINLLQVETDYIVGTFRLRRSMGTLLEETPEKR